jgi:flagellar FliL protein
MSNKLMLILVGVILVLMIGIGAGLFLMWGKISSLGTETQAPPKPEESIAEEQQVSGPGPLFDMKTLIVNLADTEANRYLRVTMNLELSSDAVQTEMEKRLPQVRDTIIKILTTRTFEEINTIKGKIALRDEIISKVNSYFTSGSIVNIYFTEFIVQ